MTEASAVISILTQMVINVIEGQKWNSLRPSDMELSHMILHLHVVCVITLQEHNPYLQFVYDISWWLLLKWAVYIKANSCLQLF